MKIICIGRNYVAHAKELNNPIPKQPVVFFKPDTALLKHAKPFYYPDFSNNIHYEAEIVLKICKNGKHIQEKFAHKYYQEITIGIDLTARDIQDECKIKGHPWERAKAFDNSAILGDFINTSSLKSINNIGFYLTINKQRVQNGESKDMLFSIDQIISNVSKFVSLKQGDLIFTGTPSGVGPIKIGDTLEGFIENQSLLKCEIK
tara:strand:+ start:1156 stop:1767 length:612 start_codon:yes stop_codon:yes gene_type:complete